MGAGRKHRKVEKDQIKAKFSLTSTHKKKKRAAHPGQGTAALRKSEQLSQAKLFQTAEQNTWRERRRCTALGSAPAPRAARSHSHTFSAWPREALQARTPLPLDSRVQMRRQRAGSAAPGQPQAIAERGARALTPVNGQIEIFGCFWRVLW